MSKFGAETDDYVIVKSRFGPAHAVKQGNGSYAVCDRKPAFCKYCHEDGVPQSAPDPIDAMIDALRANWSKRWSESYRHPVDLPADRVWEGRGLHIVALSDEDPADRTLLISFGDDHTITAAVGALVHVHNEMIGKPD